LAVKEAVQSASPNWSFRSCPLITFAWTLGSLSLPKYLQTSQ